MTWLLDKTDRTQGPRAPTLFAPRGLQNTMWELYIDIACGSFAIDAAPTRQWLSPAAGYHLPSAAGLAAFERIASAISLPSMLQPPELGRRRTYLKWWRRERGEGRGVVRGVVRGVGCGVWGGGRTRCRRRRRAAPCRRAGPCTS